MERILAFKDLTAFFKNIAKKSKDIKDYVGSSKTELQDKMSSVAGIKSPFLCFFSYRGKLEGNSQRTASAKTISFAILFAGVKIDDFEAQDIAVSEAETIGLKVLARINILSKMESIIWLYKNFEQSTVRYDQLRGEEADGFFGMEFHFDLKVPEPLIVNPDDWSDGDIFCQ